MAAGAATARNQISGYQELAREIEVDADQRYFTALARNGTRLGVDNCILFTLELNEELSINFSQEIDYASYVERLSERISAEDCIEDGVANRAGRMPFAAVEQAAEMRLIGNALVSYTDSLVQLSTAGNREEYTEAVAAVSNGIGSLAVAIENNPQGQAAQLAQPLSSLSTAVLLSIAETQRRRALEEIVENANDAVILLSDVNAGALMAYHLQFMNFLLSDVQRQLDAVSTLPQSERAAATARALERLDAASRLAEQNPAAAYLNLARAHNALAMALNFQVQPGSEEESLLLQELLTAVGGIREPAEAFLEAWEKAMES